MSDHPHIERLIPWYVNGTLSEAELDRVNAHLQSCATCRQSVAAELAFARTVCAKPPGLAQVESVAVARTRLRGQLARGQPARRGRLARRRLTPAAAVAALIVVIAAVSFLAGRDVQPPPYRTLSTAAGHDGPVLQLMFVPDASEQAIRRLLLSTGGELMAGPGARGVYRLGLPPDRDGAAAVARLRELPQVRWVTLEAP